MAGHGELETAAERVAMDCGDDRLRGALDILQARVKRFGARERLLPSRHRLENVGVGSGHECLAGADEDEGLYGRVLHAAGDGVFYSFQDAGPERIHRRVVDRDDGNRVADFVLNHRSSLYANYPKQVGRISASSSTSHDASDR